MRVKKIERGGDFEPLGLNILGMLCCNTAIQLKIFKAVHCILSDGLRAAREILYQQQQ